ncbi:MAG TPA: response regulator [Methylomirabilota bacterium]|nr:response regulator [Methylomirabilota bacterium]
MSSTPLAGVRLLLVDDDAGVREGLHDFFVDCGAAVVDAGSARAGLSAFIAAPPDVVVSDIRMPPGEDGFWLISAIRALPAGAGGAVPALALTGDPAALDKAAGAGFQAARAKPARLAELVTLVAQLASR